VYLTLRDPAVAPDRPRTGERVRQRVGPTVVLLGMVSFFTDVSSEMVTSVLPIYLTVAVGLSPLGFGLVDGVQQGFSAFVRLGAGVVSDRLQRCKGVAAVGYGLSAVSRLLLVLSPAGAAAVTGIVALDRTGKGIRTAPRDAMIAAAAPEGRTGAAFGVHRALDSAGAALGPLLALTVLLVTLDDYRAVFVCSTGLAVVGLAVLSLVRDPSADRPRRPRTSAPSWSAPLRDTALRRVCLAAGLLALLTVSDAFLLLVLQQRTDLNPGWFPLLFVGLAGSYAVLALPAGRLTDRFGAVPVLVAGHVVLVVAYAALLPAALPVAATVVVLVLLGSYYAATDGVLMALVARRLPAEVRGTAMGAVQTAVAGGRLLSSVAFGALWWRTSPTVALLVFVAGMLLVLPVAARLLRPHASAPAGAR
jgi:MFS family permease